MVDRAAGDHPSRGVGDVVSNEAAKWRETSCSAAEDATDVRVVIECIGTFTELRRWTRSVLPPLPVDERPLPPTVTPPREPSATSTVMPRGPVGVCDSLCGDDTAIGEEDSESSVAGAEVMGE